jgi:thermostable 8-oxoguanine DNA glycosylase
MNLDERFIWAKEEFEHLSARLDGSTEVNPDLFYRIRNWKISTQSKSSESEIREKTRIAFEYAEEDEPANAVSVLSELDGVRIPMASSILAMRYPDKFAVIDKWVIEGLGRKEWLETYKTEPMTYVSYLGVMRSRAKEVGRSLRDYERTLFELSLKNGKKK